MTTEDQPPLIPLPAASLTQLADLLTQLDQFLRSSPLVTSELAGFLARRGGLHVHPRFAANNIIDELSFTALHLTTLTGSTSRDACGAADTADRHAEDPPSPGP